MYEDMLANASFSTVGATNPLGTPLTRLMMAEAIEPGSDLGYELAKILYTFHPLGAKMTEKPITLAQSIAREIAVPVRGEPRIVARFVETWDKISKIGATAEINNLMTMKRVYGISSLGVGELGKETSTELDLAKIKESTELYFNVLDPLNTAGSLVLDQNPNSPNFLKPKGALSVSGQVWHASRSLPVMNERPLFIEWTPSAFGFVGRSVYQRALYPMKSYLQAMVTDQMIVQKAGLLVYKAASPGSVIDKIMLGFAALKRTALKAGNTGNVAQIGIDEDLQTLNFTNLEGPYALARTNIIKNIATACGMPASMLLEEALAEGFGEGVEDSNKEIQFLNYIREEMGPAYTFMDRIVQRKAWTAEFKETLHGEYPEIAKQTYETWLHECIRAFSATWPNLKIEPESEKAKNQDVKFKAVIAALETMLPILDPDNSEVLIAWAADNFNEFESLFTGKINFDPDKLIEHLKKKSEAALMPPGEGEEEPKEPKPFAAAA
jgi:Protein of unknown function (DUF1073)